MTTYKKGDRVKVTIEGVVARDQSTRDLFLNVDRATYPAHHVVDTTKPGVTVEKLADPLPTTPGSVIRNHGYGHYRLLVSDGTWVSSVSTASGLAPDDLDSNYEVVYDAVMER